MAEQNAKKVLEDPAIRNLCEKQLSQSLEWNNTSTNKDNASVARENVTLSQLEAALKAKWKSISRNLFILLVPGSLSPLHPVPLFSLPPALLSLTSPLDLASLFLFLLKIEPDVRLVESSQRLHGLLRSEITTSMNLIKNETLYNISLESPLLRDADLLSQSISETWRGIHSYS